VQSFSASLLSNTIRAILTHVEQTPDVPRHHPELIEFTRILEQYNARLHDRTRYPSCPRREIGSRDCT